MKKKFLWGFVLVLALSSYAFSESRIIRLEFSSSPSPLGAFGGRKVISQPKLGLALSGGGARGLAQIGVLKVLERENIPIYCIAGTSMGGIIGGLCAAGYSASELERLALSLDWQDLFSDTPARLSLLQLQREETEGALFQIRWNGLRPYIPPGLTSAQKLTNLFSGLTFQADYFSGSDFGRLRIIFRAVTTDLVSGEKVVLDTGELALALRATMAVPVAVTPVPYQGMLLVDGGLVDPVPVDVVRREGADPVIAVNTTASLLSKNKIEDPLDVAGQSTSIMTLDKKKESLRSADLIIEPDLKGLLATDFDSAKVLIQKGEEAAELMLPQIKLLLGSDNKEEWFRINEIEFEGNQAISTDSLRFWSALAFPGAISFRQIYRALQNIYQKGYFQDIYAGIDSSANRLVFHLQENPPVQEVVIQTGLNPTREIRRFTRSNPRSRILSCLEVKDTLEAYLKALRQQGFSLAQIVSVDYQPEQERLVAVPDQGLITGLQITGNAQTDDWMIYSRFPLKKGTPFNLKSARQGLASLQSSGYFDQVNLSISKNSGGAFLNLSVSEKKFYILRGGLHYWDEYHLEGFLESGHTNLMGTGNQLYAGARYGDRRENYYISLRASRIFRTNFTYHLSLYYRTAQNKIFFDHQEIGEFGEIRRGGSFRLGHNLARLGNASFEFQSERVSLDNSVSAVTSSPDKRSFFFRILFDNLDRYPYPQKGNYNQLNLEIASRVLGGEISYRKFRTSLETYWPVSDKFNLHPALHFGYSEGELPLFEKFSLGGKENFYGNYSQEQRGDNTWLASLELRLKSARRIHWFARYDVGKIWEKGVTLRHQQHAFGLKLGITTPLGPIELAYGLNSEGFDKFYISLGYVF